MKLVFFGTSHGVPEAHRRCSSTLIEAGGRFYIIDMGTHAVECLADRGIPLQAISAIFITHMHGDHNNGLIPFVDLCNWRFLDADPQIFLPEPVDKTLAALKAWIECNGSSLRENLRFSPVHPGVLFDDGVLRLTAYPTRHIQNSHAFLVEAEGRRVLFTGDLCHKGPQEDFPLCVLDAPLDLAICESAHFPATAYLPVFLGQSNLRRVCINHYYEPHIPSIYAAAEKLAAAGIPLTIATDNLEIQL